MRKLTVLVLSSALIAAPSLVLAQGMKDLGNAIVKDSADAAAGAAKKNVDGAVGESTGAAHAEAEAAAAPAKKLHDDAEAVQKDAENTKKGVEGLGNSFKTLGQ